MNGISTSTSECSLGCSSDGSRCAAFKPSNSLGDALAMSALQGDVELGNVTIDNDGNVLSGTTHVQVTSIVVNQLGVPPIRAYLAHSFKFHSVTIVPSTMSTGGSPIAFVSDGPITIDGIVDGGFPYGHPVFFGAGSQPTTSACAGVDGPSGGSGGGNATNGGDSAPLNSIPVMPGAAGGPAQPDAFEPLVGGCPGGADELHGGLGGNGGAGLEFLSTSSITIAGGGGVNVGGQGGADAAGGGSGGNLVLEAPTITVAGLITANGGSGGACGLFGHEGPMTTSAAASVGGCGNAGTSNSGSGGTGTQSPGIATISPSSGAGGGGAAGRVAINTADGTYVHDSALLSAKITSHMLVRN
jgi:hypothetical protein